MFVKLTPFLRLLASNQLAALIGVRSLFRPFYTITYLAAAKSAGLLQLLQERELTIEELNRHYAPTPKAREALEAWLQLGVRLKQLNLKNHRYALRGLAAKLARPRNDAALALLQEVATLHHQLILYTPQKLTLDQSWSLADQDGELTARSSRTLEAFQLEAIHTYFPVSGATRLLEIGCGAGIYIERAAARNPALVAVGIEVQCEVAELAQKSLRRSGLETRCRIETGDIRDRIPDRVFDIATLFNNIYYFSVEERTALLRHVKGFIRPGGFLLLTTCCQGGSLGVDVLNLWGAATKGAGRLPYRQEMSDQLRDAGYTDVKVMSLVPGDTFYSFKAHVGGDFGSP